MTMSAENWYSQINWLFIVNNESSILSTNAPDISAVMVRLLRRRDDEDFRKRSSGSSHQGRPILAFLRSLIFSSRWPQQSLRRKRAVTRRIISLFAILLATCAHACACVSINSASEVGQKRSKAAHGGIPISPRIRSETREAWRRCAEWGKEREKERKRDGDRLLSEVYDLPSPRHSLHKNEVRAVERCCPPLSHVADAHRYIHYRRGQASQRAHLGFPRG